MSGAVAILGVTSGIGKAIAEVYASQGRPVIVAARDDRENEVIAADLRIRFQVNTQAIHWDAEDFASAEDFADACEAAAGGSLDGVVLCCGYMEEQSIAERDWSVTERTINVNYTGPVAVLNVFANRFQERGSGFIVGIGSVAGDRGRRKNYLYGSAKAAFAAYMEGLRHRLYGTGVQAMTVKPGFVDTAMTWGKVPKAAAPADVAKAIVKAQERGKAVIYVPPIWRIIMLVIRHLPSFIFNRMNI